MSTDALQAIEAASRRIRPYLHTTPFVPFDYLNRSSGKEVWLKCENLQKTGSFKIRGAANCILENVVQAKRNGVIAASAGNHAQGVAAISSQLGVKATIVMPEWASAIKVQNTLSWGASVVLHGQNLEQAFEHAQKLSQEKGLLFIHPYRDPLVIAGQGTLALEMMDDPVFADMEAVVIAIGGGGLMTGCAQVLRARRPDIKIYGVTAKHAPAAWKSFQTETAVENPVSPTLADGIALGRTDPGMLQHLVSLVDEVFCLSEESIASAIALLVERAKLVVEGSGALPIAAIVAGLIPEKKITALLCGGNIDIPTFSHVLQHGLVEQGRLVRLSIRVSDQPGGLNTITQILAKHSANVLQVFHQRASLQCALGETDVEVEFETKGRDHTEEIIAALHGKGLHVSR